MEINALFDLWDSFMSSATFDPITGRLNQPFYLFSKGMENSDIIDWFSNQNPFFMDIEYKRRNPVILS